MKSRLTKVERVILSWILAVMLVFCGNLPVMAAIPTKAGIVSITDFAGGNGGSKGDGSGQVQNMAETIYFGSYNSTPILWRVLTNGTDVKDASGTVAKKGIFLLSDKILYNNTQFDTSSIVWGIGSSTSSAIRNDVNGSGFLDKSGTFSDADKLAIAQTTNKTEVPGSGGASTYTTTDRVFLLTDGDITQSSYGFINDGNTRRALFDGVVTSWWLRSPNGTTQVDIVNNYGWNGGSKPDSSLGVRPALNLDQSKVLFLTAAESSYTPSGGTEKETGKSKVVLGEGFTLDQNYDGSKGWKVTLLNAYDQTSNPTGLEKPTGVKVTQSVIGETVDNKAAAAVETVEKTIDLTNGLTSGYGDVTVTYDGKGSGNYVSAVLKTYDESAGTEGAYCNYAKISNQAEGTSGKIVDINGDKSTLADGTYHMYIYSEQANDDKSTDYASAFATINTSDQYFTLHKGSTTTYSGKLGASYADNGLTAKLGKNFDLSFDGGGASYDTSITLDATNGTGTITAGDGGTTLTGSITVGTGQTLTVANNFTLSGSSSFSVTGTGTLTITGNTTINKSVTGDGAISIGDGSNAAKLVLGTDGSLANDTKVAINTNAIFSLTAAKYGTYSDTITNSGTIELTGTDDDGKLNKSISSGNVNIGDGTNEAKIVLGTNGDLTGTTITTIKNNATLSLTAAKYNGLANLTLGDGGAIELTDTGALTKAITDGGTAGTAKTIIAGTIDATADAATIGTKITINGSSKLKATAKNIGGAVTVSDAGTLELTGDAGDTNQTGTLTKAIVDGGTAGTAETIIAGTLIDATADAATIGTKITINGSSKLKATAKNIGGAVTVSDAGTLELTGDAGDTNQTGTLTKAIVDGGTAGTAKTIIAGTLIDATANGATIGTKITINGSSKLKATAKNVGGAVTLNSENTNYGALELTGTDATSDGKLSQKISGAGDVTINGIVGTNANNFDSTLHTLTVAEGMSLMLTGNVSGSDTSGKLTKAITDGGAETATTIIDGTLIDATADGATIGTKITVNANKKLKALATNIGGAVTNAGTLEITGGALSQAVTNNGSVNFTGTTTVTSNITDSAGTGASGTIDVANTADVTLSGTVKQKNITNAGILNFSGTSSLTGNITGTGTTNIQGDATVTITGSISQQALTITGGSNGTQLTFSGDNRSITASSSSGSAYGIKALETTGTSSVSNLTSITATGNTIAYGIYNSGSDKNFASTVNFSSGAIDATSTANSAYGILTQNQGKTTITGLDKITAKTEKTDNTNGIFGIYINGEAETTVTFSGSNRSITATSTKGAAYGIKATSACKTNIGSSDSNVNEDVGITSIKATSTDGAAYGIYTDENSAKSVTFTAGSSIEATSTSGTAYSVYSEGGNLTLKNIALIKGQMFAKNSSTVTLDSSATTITGNVTAEDAGAITLKNSAVTGDIKETKKATNDYGTIKFLGENTVDGAVELNHGQNVTSETNSFSLTQKGTETTDTIKVTGDLVVSGGGSLALKVDENVTTTADIIQITGNLSATGTKSSLAIVGTAMAKAKITGNATVGEGSTISLKNATLGTNVSNSIANSGTFDVAGTTTVTGNITGGGTTTINSGSSLSVGGTVTQATVTNNNTLSLTGTGASNIGTLTNNGTTTVDNASAVVTLGTVTGNAGTLSVTKGTVEITGDVAQNKISVAATNGILNLTGAASSTANITTLENKGKVEIKRFTANDTVTLGTVTDDPTTKTGELTITNGTVEITGDVAQNKISVAATNGTLNLTGTASSIANITTLENKGKVEIERFAAGDKVTLGTLADDPTTKAGELTITKGTVDITNTVTQNKITNNGTLNISGTSITVTDKTTGLTNNGALNFTGTSPTTFEGYIFGGGTTTIKDGAELTNKGTIKNTVINNGILTSLDGEIQATVTNNKTYNTAGTLQYEIKAEADKTGTLNLEKESTLAANIKNQNITAKDILHANSSFLDETDTLKLSSSATLDTTTRKEDETQLNNITVASFTAMGSDTNGSGSVWSLDIICKKENDVITLTADKIKATTVSGTLNLGTIRYDDKTKGETWGEGVNTKTVQVIEGNAGGLIINKTNLATSGFRYEVSQNATDKTKLDVTRQGYSGTLADIVRNKQETGTGFQQGNINTYYLDGDMQGTAGDDAQEGIGTLKRVDDALTTPRHFVIYGYGYTITAKTAGNDGITTNNENDSIEITNLKMKDFGTALTIAAKTNAKLNEVTFSGSNAEANIINNGTLTLTGKASTFDKGIKGDGTTIIDTDMTATAKISQASIQLNAPYKLTASADYIGGALTNNGSIDLTGGELTPIISGDGTVTISGDVSSSSANNFADTLVSVTVTEGATLTLASDTLSRVIENSGTVKFKGAGLGGKYVTSGTLQFAADTEVDDADYIAAETNTVDEGKTLTIKGGELIKEISGSGTTEIAEDVKSSVKIGTAIKVDTDKKLTISADNIGGSVTNDGTLELDGEKLAVAVASSGVNLGTLDLKNALEIAAEIKNQDIILNGDSEANEVPYSIVEEASYISGHNNNLTFNGGGFDFTDSKANTYTFNEINLTGDGYLKLDVDLAKGEMDRITGSAKVTGTPILHITALTLLTEANSEKTDILFADEDLKSYVACDVTEDLHVGSNTQKYSAEYDKNTGKFTFTKLGASETTKAVSDTANLVNFAWINTVNNLQKRMGELRGGQASNMAWARFQRNNDDINVGRDESLSGNLYQLGYDFLIGSNKVANNYFGVSFDVFDGSQSFKIGGGTARSMTLSAYYTKIYESGHYFDLIFRYGRFDSDTQSYDAGIATKLDYAQNSVSLSGEYGYRANLGKDGLYLEPQAEFIYGYLSGAAATSSANYLADVDSTNHFLTRFGLALGQRVKNFNYYLRGSYYHDFAGTVRIKYGDATYKQEGAQNWWELSLGGGWNLSKVSYFYAELTKHFKDISNSLNFNLGFRFTL